MNDSGFDASTSGDGGVTTPAYATTAERCTPDNVATLFPYALADSAWTNIDLAPSDGMLAIVTELRRLKTEDLHTPIRIRLAPGTYAATDVGAGEIYVDALMREADGPILIEAMDKTPNATRLSQGFNLVGVSFLAFDGLTIGPETVGVYHRDGACDVEGVVNCYHDAPAPLVAQAGIHIAGTAISPSTPGEVGGHLVYSIYGRYLPSHDIVVRRTTIQNVFDSAELSGRNAEGAGSDGIKFNQSQDVWVIESSVRQTSRHGIDNVGVHGACYLGNTISETGLGLGLEAKGGSVDITYDSNVFYDVRKVELGGENTDATYYWSAEEVGSPEHYAYEARRLVVRNNVIIDAREGALEYSGCHDCAAVNNTVVFTSTFDTSPGGGDAIREVDSQVNRDGAGTDCVPLGGDTLDVCWGVGPFPADLVPVPGETGMSRVLNNARNVLVNNVFASESGLWGPSLNPYNHPNSTHSFGLTTIDYNYWWNGPSALDAGGEMGWLVEGAHSVYTGLSPNADPGFALGSLVLSLPSGLRASALLRLRPALSSSVDAHGNASQPFVTLYDASGGLRGMPPAIGALEPND